MIEAILFLCLAFVMYEASTLRNLMFITYKSTLQGESYLKTKSERFLCYIHDMLRLPQQHEMIVQTLP